MWDRRLTRNGRVTTPIGPTLWCREIRPGRLNGAGEPAELRVSRIITERNRAELVRSVQGAPAGARLDLMIDLRSLAQNRMMWRLLGEVADQVKHCGETWSPDDWKCAFLKASGRKLQFMPALDGEGVVAIGYRSSKLTSAEMSDMIEQIYAFGAEKGVIFDKDET